MTDNVVDSKCKEERDEIKGLIVASEARLNVSINKVELRVEKTEDSFTLYKDNKAREDRKLLYSTWGAILVSVISIIITLLSK